VGNRLTKQDLRDLERMAADLLGKIDRGEMAAPSKLVRLLQAVKNAAHALLNAEQDPHGG
jgi:hypothetical protein